jgi:hypothetical protein
MKGEFSSHHSVAAAKSTTLKRQTSTILTGKKNKTDLVKALANNNSNHCQHKMKNYWRSLDVFGEKVEFTFKGKRTYQTSIGAFFSLLIKIILAIFITYEFYAIFTRKHPAVSVKHAYINLRDSENPYS